MADQPPPSGSRWEPHPDDPVVAPQDLDGPDHMATYETEQVPTTASPDAAAEDRRAQLRKRSALAGAATALALGGGIAGFVIGHGTAGDDNGFRPSNFTGQPGGQLGGQLGEGQQPRGFRDGDPDGDGDHGFGQPPQGSTQGSNDGSGTTGSGAAGSGTPGNPT